MTVRDVPLSEIAISAGFANQSHLTRVFSDVVGLSPGMWRREAYDALGKVKPSFLTVFFFFFFNQLI